jgi:hypothetical protein
MTRTYRKWDSMIGRCHRTSHPNFAYYGGRGVVVCDRWRESFSNFLADMGEAPDGLWLDRIDNAKGYEPGNCRWVTPKQSAANRKKRGQVIGSIRQRARAAGLAYQLVIQRVRRGWPIEKALSIPVQPLGGMMRCTKVAFGLISEE